MRAILTKTASGRTGCDFSEMEQYSVCGLKGQDGLFLILQYPGLEASSTVVVAPLIPADILPDIPALTPEIGFAGQRLRLLTYRLAAIDVRNLGPVAGRLDGQDYAISRALSRLFFGN